MFNKLSNLLLDKFKRKDDLSRQVEIAGVLEMYSETARKLLPPGGRPANAVSLKNGTLTVLVESSSSANHLRLWERELRETLNKKFGTEMVRKIIYKF